MNNNVLSVNSNLHKVSGSNGVSTLFNLMIQEKLSSDSSNVSINCGATKISYSTQLLFSLM